MALSETGELKGMHWGGGETMGSDLGTLSSRCLHDILMGMSSRQMAIRSEVLEWSLLEIAN